MKGDSSFLCQGIVIKPLYPTARGGHRMRCEGASSVLATLAQTATGQPGHGLCFLYRTLHLFLDSSQERLQDEEVRTLVCRALRKSLLYQDDNWVFPSILTVCTSVRVLLTRTRQVATSHIVTLMVIVAQAPAQDNFAVTSFLHVCISGQSRIQASYPRSTAPASCLPFLQGPDT